MNFNQ